MRLLLPVLWLLLVSATARSQEVMIAAAADLRPALEEIGAQFQAATGIRVRVSYGSSGNFYQQIKNGAPFDVFLSANTDYPKKLQSADLVRAGSYYEFARGSIVLLVPAHSTVKPDGLKTLLNPDVRKIAIADPSHAPYGQAAVAALKAEGLYDRVSSKLVTGENISQAASFLLSGASDAAIVAKSLALVPAAREQSRLIEIPSADYPPIDQAMVVLGKSKNQDASVAFEKYMRGEPAAKMLKQFGFELPSGSTSRQ